MASTYPRDLSPQVFRYSCPDLAPVSIPSYRRSEEGTGQVAGDVGRTHPKSPGTGRGRGTNRVWDGTNRSVFPGSAGTQDAQMGETSGVG